MPIYEFECRKCKTHTEVFQKMSDRPPTKCDKCGGRLEKQVSASSIQFKGSGWYVTDYAGNGKKAAEKAESEAASASDKSVSDTSASDMSASDKKDSKKSDKKSKEDSPSKKPSEKASSTKVSSGD